jgi:uncharacterized membrane protein YgcG
MQMQALPAPLPGPTRPSASGVVREPTDAGPGTSLCYFFAKGECSNGATCRFLHVRDPSAPLPKLPTFLQDSSSSSSSSGTHGTRSSSSSSSGSRGGGGGGGSQPLWMKLAKSSAT